MGTRADFYIGRGKDAEWLGSIAWDGNPETVLVNDEIGAAKNPEQFRALVADRLRQDDGTRPEQGWPWPWDDSRTTDYAYAWDGEVFVWCFGRTWVKDSDGDERETSPEAVFPDMSARKNVTLGPRSGVIIVGLR